MRDDDENDSEDGPTDASEAGSTDDPERGTSGDPDTRDGADGGAATVAGDAPAVPPAELFERLARGESATLLDVRDRDEFETWRIEGESVDAVQVPYARFVQAEATDTVDDLAAGLAEPVVAVCGRGEASAYVAGLLRDAGVDAANLSGGMAEWARVYVAADLRDAPAGATVRQYRRPATGCLAYLVASAGEAAVIDPLRAFADRYVADASALGADLAYALDTHVHADHVSGVRGVAAETGATPVLPAGARERGLAVDARLVDDGEELAVGDASLTAVATPGHTSEMTSFLLRGDGGDGDGGEGAGTGESDDGRDGPGPGVLFSGDSLFLRSVARPDLEDGTSGARPLAARLHESLHERVLALPGGTRVAPGHYAPGDEPGPAGTHTARLSTLRERLDLLSLDEDRFVERVTADLPPPPANHERIVATNLGRGAVDDESALELELGPNNCAATGD